MPWRAILLSGSFLVAVFAGFTNFWTQGFLRTWSPKYLAGVVNLSPEMVGLFFTFPWIFGSVVLLGLGVVASVGAIISPTAVGLFMDGAGYRTPAPGTKDTASRGRSRLAPANSWDSCSLAVSKRRAGHWIGA